MSVLSAPSPLLAKRRHFDDENAENAPCDRHHLFSSGKRARQQYSPPAGRCHLAAVGGLHGGTVPPTTLAALQALFPGMSEETVSTVLQECGNNIDAAIRRLGELRLTVEDGSAPAEQSRQGPATPQANAGTGPDVQTANAGGLEQPAAGPTTAEQWVELLVAEMSAATDLPNAKQRAAGFLRQFEDFVARFVKQQQAAAGGATGGSGSSAAGDPSLAARAAKLSEENAVLKKAVQIQHRQLQERAGLESETQQLKAMLAQYQEQVRTLQVSNYSLSLHLQKATSTNVLGGSRNPDVF